MDTYSPVIFDFLAVDGPRLPALIRFSAVAGIAYQEEGIASVDFVQPIFHRIDI